MEEVNVTDEFKPALQTLRELLANVPQELNIGEVSYRMATDGLEEAQHGYRVNPLTGEDLTGDGDGDWQPSWVAVGWDDDLGDPLFVDLAGLELPVFTAEHGTGSWQPEPVAPTFASLLRP